MASGLDGGPESKGSPRTSNLWKCEDRACAHMTKRSDPCKRSQGWNTFQACCEHRLVGRSRRWWYPFYMMNTVTVSLTGLSILYSV